ncbi:transposase domain-containing protein [Streptomyces sp. NPDC051219]|uniref:transposase domain-containing protein n=1 Tax=Streptomyces sp. NPDC051219 TaxID=3155283 RepID=UPI003418FA69
MPVGAVGDDPERDAARVGGNRALQSLLAAVDQGAPCLLDRTHSGRLLPVGLRRLCLVVFCVARVGQVRVPAGERLSDRIVIGVLTQAFPPHLVDEVIAETGRVEQRSRLLPARVVVYFILAMCLFFGQGYEEVARLLGEGLGGAGRSWRVPTTAAIGRARRRLGTEPLKASPCAPSRARLSSSPSGSRRPTPSPLRNAPCCGRRTSRTSAGDTSATPSRSRRGSSPRRPSGS